MILIPCDSAKSHLLTQLFSDPTNAPLSFQIHRLVLENPTFYEYYRHGRLPFQNGIVQDTIEDYETIETTLSARLYFKAYSIRLDLPYQVTKFSNRDLDAGGVAGERKDYHNRGIGDIQIRAEVPIPRTNAWIGLLRTFPTGQSVYDREQPHLGTGLGISTWEPSLGYKLSLWIFEAEVEATWITRGSIYISNSFFDEPVGGRTEVTFSDSGKARVSLLARLYRDKDHEVTLRTSLLALASFSELVNLTPGITDPQFQELRPTNYDASQASLVELGIRMGNEFRMGIRVIFYPLLLHLGDMSIEQTSMDLSFSYGIP